MYIWIAIFILLLVALLTLIGIFIVDLHRDRQLSELSRRKELEDFDQL